MPIPLFVYAIGALIASYAISAAIAPKAETPKPASLSDFDIPQVEEGTPQAVIFGDVICDGWQVLWFGNMRTSAIKSKGGKK